MKFQRYTHKAVNNDVVLEILLHLPVRSLLRFRAVCKFWCDAIGSQHFTKLHTERGNKAREACLQFSLLGNFRNLKVSMKLLDMRKSYDLMTCDAMGLCRVVGTVKGLICIRRCLAWLPLSMCNTFFGKIKTLPLSPTLFSHSYECTISQYVGVGFNDEDYKVVQLLSCVEHGRLQASLYSRRANSWRELGIDQELQVVGPIKSLCKNDSSAHWEAQIGDERVILSFDMKNEVFQTITISGGVLELFPDRPLILAMLDEFSFLVLESRGEGSELIWNHESTYCGIMPIWRSDDCVVFKNCDCGLKKCDFVVLSDDCVDFKNCDCVVLGFPGKDDVVLYNYRARKFIGHLKVPAYPNIIEPANSNIELIEYQGSLVSP
ncbi:hypothetical protein SASPL_147888 [Salvia splendens]|uniref:F-box domain-containing protein n=1 Tax=Salvia splendens TaxID=180675 RepID=A0A8X8Z749_SALSN|nr:hypothetical protein SASPL_147888 [Salvia splendens]